MISGSVLLSFFIYVFQDRRYSTNAVVLTHNLTGGTSLPHSHLIIHPHDDTDDDSVVAVVVNWSASHARFRMLKPHRNAWLFWGIVADGIGGGLRISRARAGDVGSNPTQRKELLFW